MLFARDRNPNVIIDATPPAAPPPMPALPQFYGLMVGFGDPGIILAERSGAGQKIYRPGEKVGPFKLLSFDNSHIVLDWDGTKVEKALDELVVRGAPAVAANTASNTPAAPPPALHVERFAQPLGPGIDVGGGFRACLPNDSTPSGTVQGWGCELGSCDTVREEL